jgi:hypothetical protein
MESLPLESAFAPVCKVPFKYIKLYSTIVGSMINTKTGPGMPARLQPVSRDLILKDLSENFCTQITF